MLICDVADMQNQEVSNNADTDPQSAWDNSTTYAYGDEVVYGDNIYFSIHKNNTGNQPDISHLYWVVKSKINAKKIYDPYPQTMLTNDNSDIVIEYNVSNVDVIYLGNVHGDSVKVEFAGNTYQKNIVADETPQLIWGIDTFEQIDELYVQLPTPASGNLKITVIKSSITNKSAIGFVNYGKLDDLGCSIFGSIKLDVKSGARIFSRYGKIDRNLNSGYQEYKIRIRIKDIKDTRAIITKLARYRGVPILVIGDDEGVAKETIFFGVFSDIQASISEVNHYTLVLRSLSYDSFVPPTEIEDSIEKSTEAQKKEEENGELCKYSK